MNWICHIYTCKRDPWKLIKKNNDKILEKLNNSCNHTLKDKWKRSQNEGKNNFKMKKEYRNEKENRKYKNKVKWYTVYRK